jgi:hypothetical protein
MDREECKTNEEVWFEHMDPREKEDHHRIHKAITKKVGESLRFLNLEL